MGWINKEKKLTRKKKKHKKQIGWKWNRENRMENKYRRTVEKIRIKLHRRKISHKKLIGYIYFI